MNNHISVKVAAEVSGYCLQYLRRLLRCGKQEGFKIGQVWLIDNSDFVAYIEKAIEATDRRVGPQ